MINDEDVVVQVWDTAGQVQYPSAAAMHERDLFVLCCL